MNAPVNPAMAAATTREPSYEGFAWAMVDGARAFAYERREPGKATTYRVSQTAKTRLGGLGPVSDHPTRDHAMKVWIAYLGRCRLAGYVVTERRGGETVEAMVERHELDRADARKQRRPS